MGANKRVYGALCFVSGVLFASMVMFCVLTTPEAGADSGYSCMKTDLNAYGYHNTIPSAVVDIVYEIPGCIKGYGYVMDKVGTYNGMVRVTYKMQGAGSAPGMGSSAAPGGSGFTLF